MSELLGITGIIGSGKTTLAASLAQAQPSHAIYEFNEPIIEIADEFNTALHAELTYQTAKDDTELINQVLIWLVDAITDTVHFDTTWNHIALTQHDMAARPELYSKIFSYLETVKKQPSMLSVPITRATKPAYRDLLQWIGGYFIARLSKTIWEDEIFRRADLHDTDKRLIILIGVRYPAQAESIRAHGGKIIEITRPGTSMPDTSDVTEAQRDQLDPEITIINSGTVQQLDVLCEDLINDLASNTTKATYQPT